jgi:DNA-binding response OmpR family regulator
MDMPEMNGMELATKVRSASAVPVIFLTGLVTPEEARGALKGERIIAKTAAIGELVDCIGALIGT